MSKKDRRSLTLYTKMLKRKVRIKDLDLSEFDGRAGIIVNVYLVPAGVHYTVMLKDGRLIERMGRQIVVER